MARSLSATSRREQAQQKMLIGKAHWAGPPPDGSASGNRFGLSNWWGRPSAERSPISEDFIIKEKEKWGRVMRAATIKPK
jgi:hypothetical protein